HPRHLTPPLLPRTASPRDPPSFPTRRSSDLGIHLRQSPELEQSLGKESYEIGITPQGVEITGSGDAGLLHGVQTLRQIVRQEGRSEEHTSELQSRFDLVCRLLLEKTKECADT